jgi:hypothetical protein
MNLSLFLNYLGCNQSTKFLQLKSGFHLHSIILSLVLISVQFPKLAWAELNTGSAVAQTYHHTNWRHWSRLNKSKTTGVAPALTLAPVVGAGVISTAATSSTSANLVGVISAPASNSNPSTPTTLGKTALVSNLAPLSQTFNAGSAKFSVAMDDVEVLGPFPSWADAKRDYGAKGDGLTDDAPALQKALNDLGLPGKPSVLYLPSGNYKIGTTLNFKWRPGVQGYGYPGLAIVGESPATTKMTWAGFAGGAMLVQDGSFNTRYSRITWDGKGVAKYGVAHWWNAKGGTYFDASPEHVDEVFQDMDIGIMGGRLGTGYGQLNSEGQVRRVTFIRNKYAGVDVGQWNALDWWVFDSHFIDCGRGVSNTFSIDDKYAQILGAGGIYVYRSFFERSTVADFHIANTGWFSMYENVSQGSRRFFQGDGMGNNGAAIMLKGNRILDTTDPVAISNGNLGPLMLIDNQIRSKLGNSTFAVNQTDWITGRDILSIGNKYTVANPISQPTGQDRVVSIDDAVVAYSAIESTLPTMPSTPLRLLHKVYEVVPGSNAKQIQAVIDLAVANGDNNAIVHLPSGPKYDLESTLVIPSLTRIQLVGDALTTTLLWRGPANQPMIYLKGPSYATVRDMSLYAFDQAKAIAIDNADQVGGRVFIEGSGPGAIVASNLTSTQLTFQANTGFKGITVTNVKSLVAIGSGGIGPVSSSGNSNVLIADTWFEGKESKLYRMDSGTFTYVGGVMSPASHQPQLQPIVPAIDLSNFSGKASFIGASLQLSGIPNGIGIHVGTELSDSNALFLGIGGNNSKFFSRDNPNGKGNIGLMLAKMPNPSGGGMNMPNQGRSDPDFLRAMLAQLRALQWEKSTYNPPLGATNVHIYRVYAPQTQGVSISGY